MFLKKIHFQNFRGFSDFELSFEKEDQSIRSQTILLGENGLGKSNLLKGIALVTAGSNALGSLLGNADDWIQFGMKSCKISAELVTQDKLVRKIEVEIIRGSDLREIILHNQQSLIQIDEALKHTDRSYFTVGYGASRRLNKGSRSFSGSNQKNSKPKRAQSVMTLFDPDESLLPLAAWAMDLDYRSGGDQLKVVKKAINDFLPDLKFHAIDKKNGVILFKSSYHKTAIPLNLLSDGYQNITSWIGDLLYRVTESFEDYKKPLSTRGLLLIDEIDLHLHPKWQRILLDFIESKLPNFQLIATTHSPLTAQQADEGELFVLSRENKQVILKPFLGSPRLMQVSQLLMSPMFGLATDESASVEKLKNTYIELKNKPAAKKSSWYQKVKSEIEQLPVQPLKTDVFLKDKEALIKKLNKKAKLKLK